MSATTPRGSAQIPTATRRFRCGKRKANRGHCIDFPNRNFYFHFLNETKMKTKIQMLIAMFFFGSVIGLSAQDNAKTKAMDHAKKKTAQLDKFLELNDEQSEEIARINRSYFEKRSEVNNPELSAAERNDRVKGQLAQYKNEVRAVLNPEQQVKFDAKVDDLTKDMAAKVENRKSEKKAEPQGVN